jgi:Methyltransferase domain
MTSSACAEPQVAIKHYDFSTYTTKPRWSSYWHQIRSVLGSTKPDSCLVVGKGDGIIPVVVADLGISVSTLDNDPRLDPDILGDVRSIPVADGTFDVVLASQVLEHLSRETLGDALSELRRVSRRRAVISVPQRGRAWELVVRAPLLPRFSAGGVLPARTRHDFDGQHYWELGARGFRRRHFEAILRRHFSSFSTFVVDDNPYHRFYVAER